MMRSSQKFIPPTRSSARLVNPASEEPIRAPKCRRLYRDPAECIFSSTPVLSTVTETNFRSPDANNKNNEDVPSKGDIVRRKKRTLLENVNQTITVTPEQEVAQTLSASPMLTQTNSIHKQKNRIFEKNHITSDPIPAVQKQLRDVPSTSNDCASIFNFTPSPPPKRKTIAASEKKKISLEVLLTIYKMKNQLQVLRERREDLARTRKKTQEICGEE
ncbi:uncharacterized protein LOC133179869 [Saccostrea echinata]|uniref:uncharacterized protein LOC133179869 n=1 Tax=Saccostrea echinata TaxID=191078 RepID=UPI002A83B878|nr:uncharacterized protein LOC133179869 [Saccostrea echinata]